MPSETTITAQLSPLRERILNLVQGGISSEHLMDLLAEDIKRQGRRCVHIMLDRGELRLGEKLWLFPGDGA